MRSSSSTLTRRSAPDLLLAFADSITSGHDWIQCFYSVANPDASWRTRLMAYAFSLFNGVTPLGQSAPRADAGFQGNGMCFSTRSLRRVPWRSFGLVEDMEYSWNVRIAGGRIAFRPDVQVLGVMLGQGGKAAASQRRAGSSVARESEPASSGAPAAIHASKPDREVRLRSRADHASHGSDLFFITFVLLGPTSGLARHTPLGMAHCGLIGSSLLMSLALMVHAICPFLVFRLSWNYMLTLLYLPVYAVWKLPAMFSGRPARSGFAPPARSPSNPDRDSPCCEDPGSQRWSCTRNPTSNADARGLAGCCKLDPYRSRSDPEWGPFGMRHMLRNATFFRVFRKFE